MSIRMQEPYWKRTVIASIDTQTLLWAIKGTQYATKRISDDTILPILYKKVSNLG